ncbi:adenosine receptor A3-like [Pocillopora damicornis]|uniref:adenosine receptor A3-like n=1 Tax=Pocillopora damicornis TaxID=46731 RepID=UPI000F559A76|nr:adenosine receptor A3-like [Pocillopora damicornis]
MEPFSSASECIPWLVVLIIECLAIVILNIIAIVVFVKEKRQLQWRSTYLIIHLAIVDVLVGAVSGPLQIEIKMEWLCPLWNYRRNTLWSHRLSFLFLHLFYFTSLTNLIAISLERLHATFCPFRHRFVRKWVYRAMIIVIWLIAIVREVAQIFLWEIGYFELINAYLYLPFYAVSLFVICVSYILIVIKVRCSRHPQFHSRSKRERKLTGAALIVSLVSLLCLLPGTMYVACIHLSSSCFMMYFHIKMVVVVLFLANSLVNPIIYALRMPGFREGLLQLVYRVPDFPRIALANLPLRNLWRA